MADDIPDLTWALALSTTATLNSLLGIMRRKGLISADEQHELYDSALLKLEELQGLSPNDATMKVARDRLERFEKAARTR